MNYPVCVRYESGLKKTCLIRDRTLDELDDLLAEVEGDRKHIIFIDGYVLGGDQHIAIEKTCYVWLKENKTLRRLVFICSMSSRGKTNLDEDMMNNVEEFFVFSWELNDYLAAVQHEAFFNNIKHNLDSFDDDIQQSISRADMITSKFYFAGGCARFMFLYNTATVIDYLRRSVEAVSDIMPYIRGQIGDISNAVINRLFIHFHNTIEISQTARFTRIVSEWAASQLAMKGGPDLVKNLAAFIRLERNSVMDGWMFEMWFFGLLRHRGVKEHVKVEPSRIQSNVIFQPKTA
jgi:hypothetical protein